jgi:sulfopyruvate decarboxylase subunit alpha
MTTLNTDTTTAQSAGATAPAMPLAHPVAAQDFLAAIQALGVTHVLIVPDTYLKTLIAALEAAGTPHVVPVCTEDEAIAIHAGMYIGGLKSMLLIQNNGFYASINALKAIPLDARVPTLMVIGEFGRDVTRPSRDNASRAVRMIEPTLETWGVPYYRIDAPQHLGHLAEAYRRAYDERGPVAVLVGGATS